MLENVRVLCQSCIRIEGEDRVFYFDPFGVAQECHDADVIMITHDHYDHFSPEDISFETVASYNKLKPFHPRSAGWTGYLLTLDGLCYYITGDTDVTDESKTVKCDVAFLPVGGTYTMNYKEAAKLASEIMPKYVVPCHYGSSVGKKEDGRCFQELLAPEIGCKLLMEE